MGGRSETVSGGVKHGHEVAKLERGRRRRLAEMLRSCQKKFPNGNPHGVVDFGSPVGKENV